MLSKWLNFKTIFNVIPLATWLLIKIMFTFISIHSIHGKTSPLQHCWTNSRAKFSHFWQMIFLKKLKTLDAESPRFCKELRLENPVPFSQTSSWFYLKHSTNFQLHKNLILLKCLWKKKLRFPLGRCLL